MKRSKWFLTLFSFLLPFQAGTKLQACAFPPEPEELRFMLFNPDLLENKAWWSYIYNYKLTYLDGTPIIDDDETILAEDWIRELNEKIPLDEVKRCLFGTLTDSARLHNKFYEALKKNKQLSEYFEYANNEVGYLGFENEWEPEKRLSFSTVAKLIEKGETKLNSASNSFLKKRYAYQLIKIAFYYNKSDLFNRIYTQYFLIEKNPEILDWWAAHYKSVLLEKDQTDSANYYHALVFHHSNSKKYISRQLYSKRNNDKVLALARNKEEKAAILVMNEVINPARSLSGIRLIYKNDPLNKHLPLLITREINKLEDWLGSTKYVGQRALYDSGSYNYYWDEKPKSTMKNWNEDYQYCREFSAYLKGMTAIKKRYGNFYNTAMCYLNLIQQNYREAQFFLTKLREDKPTDAFQKTLLSMILLTESEDISSRQIQEKMGVLFKGLLEKKNEVFEAQKSIYSLCIYMKYAFKKRNLNYLAGLWDYFGQNEFCYTCYQHSFEYSFVQYYDRYASIEDIKKVIALKEKKHHNELEKILLLPYSDANYFKEVLGTRYMRKGDLENATQVFRQIPSTFWNSHINGPEWMDHDPFDIGNSPSFETYNKRELAEKMLQLEKEAIDDESKRAENYLLLGNAWFNFHNKSFFMFSYGQSEHRHPAWIKEQYMIWKKAKQYYQTALKYEKTKEKRAEITYMLAEIVFQQEDKKNRKASAEAFEEFSDTNFYKRKNCLTLMELARRD